MRIANIFYFWPPVWKRWVFTNGNPYLQFGSEPNLIHKQKNPLFILISIHNLHICNDDQFFLITTQYNYYNSNRINSMIRKATIKNTKNNLNLKSIFTTLYDVKNDFMSIIFTFEFDLWLFLSTAYFDFFTYVHIFLQKGFFIVYDITFETTAPLTSLFYYVLIS